MWLCVFIIFFCSYSGDPLDQGYFPVGESLNILNTYILRGDWGAPPEKILIQGGEYPKI